MHIEKFFSCQRQVDTKEILRFVLESKKRCFLPRIHEDSKLEFYQTDSLEQIFSWEPNRWGIREPPVTQPVLCLQRDTLDLVIVPGLAFDTLGHRLGRGKVLVIVQVEEENNKKIRAIMTVLCHSANK